MLLKSLEINGFKSFAKKSVLEFSTPITGIVGPNGSGKSNVAEAFRFVLGEQSIKSLRGKKGEDLIFNGTADGGRLNRAWVKLTFDNSSKFLPLDFEEVTFERIVHRDSVNEYLINGSPVRLKDITELLSSAHIGASGHHIISQGEADRILNANMRERKEMIEDALGLKIYQYKKLESERKLEKTKENIEKVESLRRELAPHIRFLRKQVEKIEKARLLREELVVLYKEYLKRETVYISSTKERIHKDMHEPKEELVRLEHEIAQAKAVLESAQKESSKTLELVSLEQAIRSVDNAKNDLLREAGRIEGEIHSIERLIRREKEALAREDTKTVYLRDVESVAKTIDEISAESENISDIGTIRGIIEKIKDTLKAFVDHNKGVQTTDSIASYEHDANEFQAKRNELEERIIEIRNEENTLREKISAVKNEIDKDKEGSMEAEKTIFKIMARQNELHAVISALRSQENQIQLEEEDLKRELNEAHILAGREAVNYDNYEIKNTEGVTLSLEELFVEDRHIQNDRRRNIEKIKIRLEEMGGGGSEEIMKEFREAEERDQFLAREVTDLEASSISLTALIKELEEKLNLEFKQGIDKINSAFTEFFQKMFGGGHAGLRIVREVKKRRGEEGLEEALGGVEGNLEEEFEEGIEIDVSHPFKKIKSLMMLSGGERALTSIALLFAISQVNPPPFIILDETDAALDEANSKKYGDMISALAKYSQLILITHNRETMSCAGVLYGVTMGSGGASKLLSIKFDEAVAVAK
ncbi:MAG: AAA family ATPase [bacterium]